MSAKVDRILRRFFRAVLNPFMVWMFKIGLGRFVNIWPSGVGRIMVIKHTGHKSGLTRYAPVNYAPIQENIYCTSGFGALAHWYLNILKNPQVELWLPEGKLPFVAADDSDNPQRAALMREVLIASGFAAPLFAGIFPHKMSLEEIDAFTRSYRLIKFSKRE